MSATTHSTYRSADEKTDIHYYIYNAKEIFPKAVLQLSHGMCEYVERYEGFAQYLNQHGVVFCGHDCLGHGATGEQVGIQGDFGDIDACEVLVADMYSLAKIVKKQYPHIPYFILGHSMGSAIARIFAEKHGDIIDGLLLTGVMGANPLVTTGTAIAQGVMHHKGAEHKSPYLSAMVFGTNNIAFLPTRTPFDWLTRDERLVDVYMTDERSNFIFSASAYRDLFKVIAAATAKSWYEKIDKGLPILIFCGTDDPVGNYGIGPREVEQRLKDHSQRDVKLIMYKGGRHEMINEINRKEVYMDVLGWILSRCKR